MPSRNITKKNVAVVGSLLVICVLGLGLGLGYGFPRFTYSPSIREPSPSRLGKYRSAAVSSDGVPCSDIGRDVLKDGGSAVDSAIATLFCIGLVNTHSAGIGGGFLMTIYDRETKTAISLNARETAPLAATEDMFHGNASLATKGPLAVAVPGEVAGYWAAHQRYGKLPWSRLVLPTAALAEAGTNVSRHMANALKQEAERIKLEPSMWRFVNPETGEVWKEGDLLRRPELAATLREIAEFGADVLYNGTLGDKLVQDIKEKGGIITKEDLQTYQPVWSDSVSVQLNDNLTLHTVPPPGSGVLLAYILNILDEYHGSFNATASHNRLGAVDDPLSFHRIAEAFKHAYAQRTKLGDPNFVEISGLIKNLTSEYFAAETRAKINDSFTSNDPDYYGAVTYQPDDSGTAHVSILAPDGSAVSATSTINLYFGAGFASRQTGVVLNDEMDDFSAPNITNAFGIPPSPANFIAPGKRPLSSMCPMILVHSQTGQVRLVTGAAGGTKITTATALTVIRNLWMGEDIKEAIDAPRMHHQLFPMELQYEEGFPMNLVDELMMKGHNTSTYRLGAVVTAVSVENDGFIYANSDFRKGGDVAGIDEVTK